MQIAEIFFPVRFDTSSMCKLIRGRNSDVLEIRVRNRVRVAKYLGAESRVSPERPFPAAPESRVSPVWPQALNNRVPSERGKNSGLTRNSEGETRNLRRELLSRLIIAFESVTFFLYYERRTQLRV